MKTAMRLNVTSGFLPLLVAGAARQGRRLLSVPAELALRSLHASGRLPRVTPEAPRELLPALRGGDADVLAAIVRDGFHVTSLDALNLADTSAMLSDADVMCAALEERARLSPPAGRQNVTARGGDLLRWQSVLRWGLDARLLDIAEAYIGAPAAYDCPLFYRSLADGREAGVRRWHRDREDTRMLKVAVYLNDVDEDGGPFQTLTPDLQAKVDQRASWRYAAMDQAKLGTSIRESDWAEGVRSITGARGTVIFVDTARCHHRGKPPTDRDRTAVFHSYFSRRPSHPWYCERSPLSRRQIAELAAPLPRRERDCLLWRQQLPWTHKLIPRSRLTI